MNALPHTRRLVVALTAVTAVLVAPIAVYRWAPVTDLADYEYVFEGLRRWGDQGRFPSSLYELQIGAVNQLVFLVGAPLVWALGSDLGTRCLLALIVAAFPWSVAHAARSLGRTPWVAVPLSSLVVGAAYRWGLLGYLLSVSISMWCLRPLVRLLRAASARDVAIAAGAVVLATTAHASAFVVLATMLAPLVLSRADRVRRVGVMACAFAPSLLLTAWQFRRFTHELSPTFRALAAVEHPRAMRAGLLADNLVGPFEGATSVGLLALLALAVAMLRRGRPAGEHQRWLALGAAALIAQYWIWPFGHDGAGLLYLRFLMPGAALLALALCPEEAELTAMSWGSLFAVPLATTVAMLPLYRESDAIYRATDRIAAAMGRPGAVAAVDFVHPPWSELGVFGRPAAHLVARTGGRTWAFPDAPQCPLHVRSGRSWFSAVRFMRPGNFAPSLDLQRYTHVLVSLPDARMAAELSTAMSECARLVVVAPPFALYESRCVRSPWTAPEPEDPSAAHPDLSESLRALESPRPR